MNGKQIAAGALFASILLTLVIIPIAHQQSGGTYDPWMDYNEDGIIDINELYPIGQSYGSTGDPTRNVMTKHSCYEWGQWSTLLAYGDYMFYNDTRGYGEVSITVWTNATIGVLVSFYPSSGTNGPAVEVDYFLHTSGVATHRTYPVISGRVCIRISNPDPTAVEYGLHLYVTS